MKRRILKALRTAVFVGMICLAAAPAWAGLAINCYCAYLDGVDRCGNLTPCGGTKADFVALVNTCTGKLIGVSQGCVQNCSHCPQLYCNGFGCIYGVNVCSSLYYVSACGDAFLIAQGYVSL